MFRRLRLSLAMANLSVIVVIFLLLGTGTYLFVQQRLVKGAEFMLSRLADDLVAGRTGKFGPGGGPPPDKTDRPARAAQDAKTFAMMMPLVNEPEPVENLPPSKRPGPGVFHAKLGPDGQIVSIGRFSPVSEEDVAKLVRQVQKVRKTTGSIWFDEVQYLYRVAPLSGNRGEYIVFQDFRQETNLLRVLVTAVSLAGLACVVLSLIGSFFMADRALIPIQQAWKQQKEFLADASHELRTPLTIIQTNLELVRSNPEETVQSQGRWLANIQDGASTMAKLVNSLLFLARADAHQQVLSREAISLGQAATAATEAFYPLASTKGVKLEVLSNTSLEVYGDEEKLRQVVSILLDNAIRHTPTGGTVIVALRDSHQGVLMSVTDSGEGIEPEHLQNIFHRFYQGDPSRSRGGAGLGLAIAKWIVESHGGTISVSSALGKGTEFMVWLPKAGEEERTQRNNRMSGRVQHANKI